MVRSHRALGALLSLGSATALGDLVVSQIHAKWEAQSSLPL
jgi:hypothetical protein